MDYPIVLSYLQLPELFAARLRGDTMARVSLDLGQSRDEIRLTSDALHFSNGERLSWDALAEIERGAPTCFVVEGGEARKIHCFSTALNRPYTLMATTGAPTLINAGFTMHRIVGVDPGEDTRRKIRAFGTLGGPVLDTCTGLGYTALELAASASSVLTVELDPLVLEICRLNPWSRGLFENPRIEQRIGDVAELIETFHDEQFAGVLHDPPTVALAGDLYGGAFYRQLLRVLRRGGTLFHYVGNLESKQGGIVTKGVLRRLREAGFTAVTPRPESFGITAKRP